LANRILFKQIVHFVRILVADPLDSISREDVSKSHYAWKVANSSSTVQF